MITIRDVAGEANVSISTVSRVLNNNPNVSRDKYNRVMEAIEKVGYVPQVKDKQQPAAADLVSDDPEFAGYILIIAHAIIKEAVFSIQENAAEYGYEVIINYTGGEGYADKNLYRYLDLSGKLAGIIAISPSNNDMIYDDEIFRKYPVVQIGSSSRQLGDFLVSTDDFRCAHDMTSYLLRKGHRDIVMLAGEDREMTMGYASQRETGFTVAMRGSGVDDKDIRILRTEMSLHGGHVAARQLLAEEKLPDAVFSMTDFAAIGFIHELEKHGCRVPEDIAVCCINSEGDYNPDIKPKLTAAVQSYDEIGAESVRLLRMLAADEVSSGRKSYIGYHLIEGETA